MKKIINVLFMVLSAAFYLSCTPEQENLFGELSANRIDASLKATHEILTGAPNGWHMEYFPSKTQQYGGYNIFVSFAADGNVTVSSDVARFEAAAVTSMYSLKQSAGPMLSFDTYNEVFHYFSDPSNLSMIGMNGKGMEGDLEFRIMEAGKEKIVLEGRKTRNRIVMTPIDAGTNWKTYLNEVIKADEEMTFVNCRYVADDVSGTVLLSDRNLEITYVKDENSVTVKAPFIVTKTGYKLYKTLELGSAVIDGFTYTSSGNAFEFTSSDGKAKLLSIPLNEQFVAGSWFFALSKIGSFGAPSWNEVKADYAKLTGDETFFYAYLGTQEGYGFCFASEKGRGIYKGTINYTYELIGEDQVKYTFASSSDKNGGWYYTNARIADLLKPISENVKGASRTFKITADNMRNPAWVKLQDVAIPENHFTLTKRIIADPFNK